MLNRVTLTGIDNRTEIEDLVKLQREFPFAEFGVLISQKLSNKNENNRYPHLTILKKLKNKDLNLSCHVCGSIAREIVNKGNWCNFDTLLKKDRSIFGRIQLNVSGTNKFKTDIDFPEEFEIIIQQNKDNMNIYEHYKGISNVVGFQDNSGGLGKYENSWMFVNEKYFGYAGGLSEENVVEAIESIMKVNNNDFWIDMESSVRTNEWLDTEKCRRVLELCKPYIQK